MNKSSAKLPSALAESRENLSSEMEAIGRALYSMIVMIDLEQDIAWILHNVQNPETISKAFPWAGYLEWYAGEQIVPEDERRAIETLSSQSLLAYFQEGHSLFSQDFSFLIGKMVTQITITAFLKEPGSGQMYLLVRNAENSMLRQIVNQYVFSNCDYFICLDAKSNSYVMFSGSKSGTPLPPSQCSDYETETVTYARAFVAEEDQDMVIQKMRLSSILTALEEKGIHSFTCGVIENDGSYTRKRLDYTYYDRKQQLILLSRSDITAAYLEEQKHIRELEEALLRAQTDPLTGLWNSQAVIDHIDTCLDVPDPFCALMFIDLDDFKKVNDTLGHSMGNHVLSSVSQILKDCLPANGFAGRIGGDEFVIFLNAISSIEDAISVAQSLCLRLQNAEIGSPGELSVSASVGIAISPKDGRSYSSLLQKADQLAYEAKRKGKCQYCI